MAKVLIVIFLLVGLASVFEKVADWFLDAKNINIIPASVIETFAVIVFFITCDSRGENDLWMWMSVSIIVIIAVFNLIKHGIKNGLLASLAELVFSVVAVFLLLCALASGSSKRKRKKETRT